MNILSQAIENRIKRISQMKATPEEIEHAIKLLCLAVAGNAVQEQGEVTLAQIEQEFSFENMKKLTGLSSLTREEYVHAQAMAAGVEGA